MARNQYLRSQATNRIIKSPNRRQNTEVNMPSGVYKKTNEQKRKMSLAKMGERNPMKRKEVALKLSGANHYLWKGDKVSYRGLHNWVQRMLGTPKQCERCGKEAVNRRSVQWANKSHKYLRVLSDWIALCGLCHKQHDKRSNQISN